MHKFNNSIWRVWRHWGQHHYITQNSQEDRNTGLKIPGQWALFTTHHHCFNYVTTSAVVGLHDPIKAAEESAVGIMMVTRESFCPLVILDASEINNDNGFYVIQKDCKKELQQLCFSLSKGSDNGSAILSNEINKT